MVTRLLLVVVLCFAFTCRAEGPTTRPVVPLTNVHAHNDYMHVHPLTDALSCGFCSVEADVHLVDGDLLVAHDHKAVVPGRTLRSLYLDPLRRRVTSNGGRVYANGPTVVLLIDVKTPFAATYPVIRHQLAEYADVLTTWRHGMRQEGAITAIITGDHRHEVIAADDPRLCASDGKLEDLDADPPAELVPWVSHEWKRTFSWRADGSPMPDVERRALRSIVMTANEQGRRVRFWGGPDNPAAWGELRAAGVDLLNTDHLPQCRDFLLGERGR